MPSWSSSWLDEPLSDPPANEADNETTLVAAARSDPQAFSQLYQRYVERIYRYCYLRLDSREVAEDATSDVFIRVLTQLHNYHGNNFASWLFSIAHNVVVDHYRRRRPQASLTDDGSASTPSPEEASGERELLRTALEQLPTDQRNVLELQLAGWSGAEIAASLQRSEAAVKMLRLRAVQQLRRLLKEEL